MNTRTVYVELLDEGVRCWRPTQAEMLDGGAFRLLAADGDTDADERWAFQPGSIVRCEPRRFEDTPSQSDLVVVALA